MGSCETYVLLADVQEVRPLRRPSQTRCVRVGVQNFTFCAEHPSELILKIAFIY